MNSVISFIALRPNLKHYFKIFVDLVIVSTIKTKRKIQLKQSHSKRIENTNEENIGGICKADTKGPEIEK